MANLSKIIQLTQAQYNTLDGGGTVGTETDIDPNAIYLIDPAAIGSSTQPIYIDSNGEFQTCNTIPALPTVVNDRYLHTNSSTGALEWSSVTSGPSTYIKSASTSGSTLTLTKQDDTNVTFTDLNYYPQRSYSSGLQISTSKGVSNTCALYVPDATSSQKGVTTKDSAGNGATDVAVSRSAQGTIKSGAYIITQSTSSNTGAATIQYDTTNECIKFIF